MPSGNLNPSTTYDINLHAAVRLARAAKAAGVRRFLFASSCSLYGGGSDGLVDERAALEPLTPYGESKMRVEQELSGLADLGAGFSPVSLRNATAYGVSRRLRADIVVNNLVGHALTSGRVLLESDGTPWRPLVHIQDISRAFLAGLEAPRDAIHSQLFNIGSTSENDQIREIAEHGPSGPGLFGEVFEGVARIPAATASTATRPRFSSPGFRDAVDGEAWSRGALRCLSQQQ